MARQIGDIKITGTIDEITFYRMDGKYYARVKSSITRKRVLNDPAFRRTMQSAARLALGSQLAAQVYRTLAKEQKQYTLYCGLKSRAIGWLKEGKAAEEVTALLRKYLVAVGIIANKRCVKTHNTAAHNRIMKKRIAKVRPAIGRLFVLPEFWYDKACRKSKRQKLRMQISVSVLDG